MHSAMKNFKIWFYLILLGLLISGSAALNHRYLLTTKHAPRGIVSLQLASQESIAKIILSEWASNCTYRYKYSVKEIKEITGLSTALKQIQYDYAFIFFYAAMLLLLLKKLVPIGHNKILRLFIIAVIIAAMADIVEDYLMTMAIHAFIANPEKGIILMPSIFISAVLKFGLLTLTSIYLLYLIVARNILYLQLRRFSKWIIIIITHLWRFRLVSIGLTLVFLVLWLSNQGQDLLISINSSPQATIVFLFLVTVLALLNWHLPKAYDNYKNLSTRDFFLGHIDFSNRRRSKVDIARMFGAVTFLIPAICILDTMQAYQIYYWGDYIPPAAVLVAMLVLYYLTIKYRWIQRFFTSNNTLIYSRFSSVTLILLAFIIAPVFVESREPAFLAYLAFVLILMSILFYIIITLRTCVAIIHDIKITPYIIGVAILIFLVFVLFNFYPIVYYFTSSSPFSTLPVLYTGIISYTLLFSVLFFYGKKREVQYVSLLLLVILVISVVKPNNYHNVDLVADTVKTEPERLDKHIENWLIARRSEIGRLQNTNQVYPVFFVNTYGGGIKAAVWTSFVIGTLDSIVREQDPNDTIAQKGFQHYVFSYSGASGGTIGASLLCASRASKINNLKLDNGLYPQNSLAFYSKDFLTPVIAGMMGRDVLMGGFGLNWCEDRARLQERNWEDHANEYGFNYSIPINKLRSEDKNKEIPLLFANTFDIDSGFKGITTSVLLDNEDFPCTILLKQEVDGNEDLRLSTAAFLSARFPYVSPTGKLNEVHHFMDGGTKDNSGAETSQQVLIVFKKVLSSLSKSDPVFKNVKPHFLSLPNDIRGMEETRRTKNLFEPLAPLVGIINSAWGNYKRADSVNHIFSKRDSVGYHTILPTNEDIHKEINPVLPLGWQISKFALSKMQFSATRKCAEMDSILALMPKNKLVAKLKESRKSNNNQKRAGEKL